MLRMPVPAVNTHSEFRRIRTTSCEHVAIRGDDEDEPLGLIRKNYADPI